MSKYLDQIGLSYFWGKLKTILDGKQPTITGAASTITTSDLSPGKSVVSNSSGKLETSDTTSLEISYLHGTTSSVQTQLDGKQPTLSLSQTQAVNSGIDSTKVGSYDTHISNTSNPHSVTKSQVGLGNVDNTADIDKPISTAVQEALNVKQATIVGGASSITSTNLTVSKVLVSDSQGKVATSSVGSTDLSNMLSYIQNLENNISFSINDSTGELIVTYTDF